MNQAPAKPVIAVFDFDGTITKRDVLLSFVFFTLGYRKTWLKLFSLIFPLLKLLWQKPTRLQLKEFFLTNFFSGLPINILKQAGERFAVSNALHRLVRSKALHKIEWHRQRGHRCIVASASVDIYLSFWCRSVGIDDLICSRLEVIDGIVTGRLDGKNCWGKEKVVQLEQLIGKKESYVLYAYGDSNGDKELLAIADHSFFRHFN